MTHELNVYSSTIDLDQIEKHQDALNQTGKLFLNIEKIFFRIFFFYWIVIKCIQYPLIHKSILLQREVSLELYLLLFKLVLWREPGLGTLFHSFDRLCRRL